MRSLTFDVIRIQANCQNTNCHYLEKKNGSKYLTISMIFFLLILAFWVSEMGIVFIKNEFGDIRMKRSYYNGNFILTPSTTETMKQSRPGQILTRLSSPSTKMDLRSTTFCLTVKAPPT